MNEKQMEASNVKAMREALMALIGVIDKYDSGNPLWWNSGAKGVMPLKDARSAFSAPPRNCDVGTAGQQEKRFNEYCENSSCSCCPLRASFMCEFAWLQMNYKEGVENEPQ